MRNFLDIPKKVKRTALQIAKQKGLAVDEYILRHGFPYYIKYPNTRDDN